VRRCAAARGATAQPLCLHELGGGAPLRQPPHHPRLPAGFPEGPRDGPLTATAMPTAGPAAPPLLDARRDPAHHLGMRRVLVAASVAASLALSGCASGPRVVPADGQAQVVGGAGGATLTVFDQEWDGEPDDLGEYLTPVPVEIQNS